jgi:hypothetical protein
VVMVAVGAPASEGSSLRAQGGTRDWLASRSWHVRPQAPTLIFRTVCLTVLARASHHSNPFSMAKSAAAPLVETPILA